MTPMSLYSMPLIADRRSIHTLHAAFALIVLLVTLGLTATPASAAEAPGTVNINQASVDQLTFLPRVGPALASRIIEHREANGKFAKTEDLILVRGIGEKTFENLEPFVTVQGKTTLARKLRTSDVEAARKDRQPKESADAPKDH